MEQPITDARLREHVVEELAEDVHLNATNIQVEVHSSKVVLSGWVGSESQRRAAERDAWWVDTVRDVDNLLVVEEGA